MRTRTRSVIGELKMRRGRSLMAVLSILIGVFGAVTMISIADLIQHQLNQDVRPDAISHTHVYLMNPGPPIADNSAYLDRLRTLDGVTDVEGQAVYPVFWRSAPDDAASPYEDGYIVAFSEPFGQAKLEPISRLIDGRYPAQGEIAVEQRFADAHGIRVGDQLEFRAAPGVLWPVVGTVIQPYFTISPASQDQIPPQDAIYINYADAVSYLGVPGLSAIHVRYTDKAAARAGLNTLIESIDRETPYVALFTFLDDPHASFIVRMMRQINNVFIILGVMAVVVSGFLVTNILNTIIAEQKRPIGVMKALGANVFDIMLIYAGIALLYGMIGTAIGLVLAVPVASLAAQAIAPLAFTYIAGFQVSPLGVEIGLLLGMLVPVLAACLPVLSGIRVSILDAMSDLGLASNWGLSPITRWIGRLPLPRTVVQALRDIYRQKGRLALTGLTLTLAAAAFMSVQTVATMLNDYVDSLFTAINYDVIITLQGMEDTNTLSQLIQQRVDGVEAIYPGYSVTVGVAGYTSTNPFTAGSNQLTATGIDPQQSAFNLGIKWQGGGVVISRSLADNVRKHVGDNLALTIGDTKVEYPIVGIIDYASDALFIDWRDLATATGYVDAQGQPVPTTLYVRFRGDRTVDRTEQRITTLSDILSANGIRATYINQPKAEGNQIQQVGLFGTVFGVAAGLLAAVGAVGLMAALSIAVIERQKEIGVMRSVGATSVTIISQFLTEGLMIGGLSWLVAVPVSVGLGVGLIAALPFDYLKFNYALRTPIIGLLGMLLVTAFASLFPALMASRKTVSEILRYQ